MPTDDRATRSAARCTAHPSTPSVALCDACGRPLCLRCAVPVRGSTYGPECLAQVLGPDGATGPKPVPVRPRRAMFEATGIALLGAVVGSILPWTRFGDPSGWFGGWGINPQRWSSVATYAAVAGLLLWVLLRARGGDRSLRAGLSLLGVATAAVAGSLLHILRPPPFTHAWLGPWVTLASSAVAVILSGLLAFAAVASNGAKRSAP